MALTSIYAHLNVSEKPFFIRRKYFSFYMRHKGMFKDIKASIINALRLNKPFYRLR